METTAITQERTFSPYGPRLAQCPAHIFDPFGLAYTHHGRIQRFLQSASEELKAYFGDYDYSILQTWEKGRRGYIYEIHASYTLHGERKHFVDGRGKSPIDALMSVNQMEQFLIHLGMLVPKDERRPV